MKKKGKVNLFFHMTSDEQICIEMFTLNSFLYDFLFILIYGDFKITCKSKLLTVGIKSDT